MTKKKPSKEKHQLKEQRKVESEVFDRETLIVLSKIIKKGIVKTLDFPISTGKEANVFRATAPDGKYAAVKIYKINTTPFFRREEYLEGDPRFKRIKKNDRDVIFAFARKEFKNLEICEKAGVHAPRPFFIMKNVLVMSFLGEEGLPYQQLHKTGPKKEDDLVSILHDVKKMYAAGLVHADLSAFNILQGDCPYLIDFGQGVVSRHSNAGKFLKRDVYNILNYFAKFGVKRDFDEVMKWIISV